MLSAFPYTMIPRPDWSEIMTVIANVVPLQKNKTEYGHVIRVMEEYR